MRNLVIHFILFAVLVAVDCGWHRHAGAQGISTDTPMTRMRPLGSPSAVDQYRPGRRIAAVPVNASVRMQPAQMPSTRNETAFWQANESATSSQASIRRTVWMQSPSFAAPPLDEGNSNAGAGTTLPQLPNGLPFPDAGNGAATGIGSSGANGQPLRPLPSPGNAGSVASGGSSVASPSDYSPVTQPSLSTTRYATVDNCNLVTAPSTYMVMSTYGCQGVPLTQTGYNAPASGPVTSPFAGVPAEIAAPATTVPPAVLAPAAPTVAAASAAPARSLFTLGQENYPVQVGQGLWGQPVAYVPGQGVRNWVRYMFP